MIEGIIPSEIPYTLQRVDIPFEQFKDGIPDKEERFRTVAREWIEDAHVWDGKDHFKWAQHWYHAPIELLKKAFTFNELTRIWLASFIQSDLGEHIKEHEFLLWKVDNSLWHFGSGRKINQLADTVEALKRLSLDLPDFEIRLTHTRYFNPQGSAQHCDKYLFLDAPFGILLYYKGEHVLSIAFGVGEEGVYLTQVQLRKKKGNRFLYKLPCHYVDLALDILRRAFGDQLWIVEGGSAATAVRKSYGTKECNMTPEDEDRIQALYNRDLANFTRTEETDERQGRTYVKLSPRCAADKAA